ncbi:MAG: hypothetical protein LBT01_06905 [Spirochaetaceae bacterium]|nr:hypothetical protein [Spirochaetaceae bacterium]
MAWRGRAVSISYHCASGAFCPRLQDEKGVINLGSDTPPLCGGDFLLLGVTGICSSMKR